jgi:aspartate ammonia-lyase
LGRERASRLALERGELNLNVFEGGAAANIFDAMDMMRRSVEAFAERCLKKIVANKKRCRELVSKTPF